jgi:biopolymer transport protein ExbB
MVEYFVRGGFFMWPILICLVLGIAMCIERFISLSRASVNTRTFLAQVIAALDKGGASAAVEVCQTTRGPVASIFHAGLIRAERGLEHVEKAITNAGTIEMAFLERGLIWLSTFITVAPMLGFTGTVSGMVNAFDEIQKANDISPSIVAGGISQALLTTLFGLVVAIILQFCHNYFIAKIDRIVIDMEESSAELVDHLVEREKKA